MTKRYKVGGMTCSACAHHIETAVKKVSGVEKCAVNLVQNTLIVDGDVGDSEIESAVTGAGYTLEFDGQAKTAAVSGKKRDEAASMLKRFWISFGFMIPLMYISMGHMFNFPLPWFFHGTQNAVILAFSQFLLAIPVLYVNRIYFINGYKRLVRRAPNMDTLIAIGSSAAMLYGIIAVFMIGYGLGNGNTEIAERYSMDLYFESAAMILTLITLGKYFETRAKSKTTDSIQKLMDLTPKTAAVIRGGEEITVSADELSVGDIVVIRPGNILPADGEITEGGSDVNYAAVTGESVPVYKTVGDKVTCGTLSTDGTFRFKAEKVGKDTTISRIVMLVEDAAASKAPIARLADKISGIFVPAVMLIAIITFTAWMIAGKGFEFSLALAIAVLVISCPCALGLATPLAIMVGTGKGAENGILIKNGECLETLSKVTTAVFDKTGTITEGKPAVYHIETHLGEEELLQIACSLEQGSLHPIGKAVSDYAADRGIKPLDAEDFKNITGKGVCGIVGGKQYFAGTLTLMKENAIDFKGYDATADFVSGSMAVFVADTREIKGLILLKDNVKRSAKTAISRLKAMGIKVRVLTGDNKAVAEKLKNELDLDSISAELLPEDKEKEIERMQKNGECVLMVGDGINDSVALTRADVGIAVSDGTDIAIDSADLVLLKDRLDDVVTAIKLSKKTIRNIKQNLFWAFIYNIIGIPIAAGALFPAIGLRLNPMIAALAMSVSSLFVALNSLRLRFFSGKIKEEVKMKKIIRIEGMSCAHCSGRVETALNAIEGVSAKVDLQKKIAEVTGADQIENETLKAAVEGQGYKVVEIKG